MERRALVAASLALTLAAPLARAQRQAKVWRVGILAARRVDSAEKDWLWSAFLSGMAEHGYLQGKNLAIELRSAEGDYERLVGLAKELVESKVDVIVAAGASSVRAAQKATLTTPIVMATAGDPVGAGFVRSLAHPGGNITGLTDVASDMGFKLLDTLLAAVPGLTPVAVLMNPGNPSHPTYLKSVDQGAAGSGTTVVRQAAKDEKGIDGAFSEMVKAGARGVIALPDPVFITRQKQIAALASAHRLPCISGFLQYVHTGGLMSYGPNFTDNARRAAAYVDRIFKGAKPGDLPVEQPTRFALAVNLRAASSLGLTLPPALLVRADHVVQ